ncbi:phosphatidylinositol 4,5-bisphosphate-binding protein [Xanthoria parietina]
MAQQTTGVAHSGTEDFAHGAPNETSVLSKPDHSHHLNPSQRGSTLVDSGSGGGVHRSDSTMSQSHTLTPSRGGTLKKKRSLSKKGSVKRSGSRRSSYAGSVKGLGFADQQYDGATDDEMNSAFFTPVPTTGTPTEILADRFQTWRKVLKDLITYFRDVQKSYESRSKSLSTLSNVINNTTTPPAFLTQGGIGDAIHVLRDYHKQAIVEANKAKTIEDDVVVQLTGLRSDLQQKIKEIKSLSGDFKNNVDRETEGTRKAVRDLQEALGAAEADPNASHGKDDPYIIRLGVDRQLERQIEEENYLHRAFLNLESSGRELESIVVGEIQKAYNALAGILKREGDEAYDTVERLRGGPVAMAKDHEWDAFVENNEHFVDPRLPVRRVQNITYPGKTHAAAAEVRSGMLERKSKYLKSYTPGWYVLTPTHIHEFKSADRITSQVPVMSLNLAEQKLGSHSGTDSSSHKFMLKGRQTGGIHRGHAWVFRAESHDTMLAWFEDLKNLTEKTGEERKAFIRRHARSLSGGSHKAPSISSEGMEEDEADQVPYSATTSQVGQSHPPEELPERPKPGGRFPSALNVNRDSQVPLSPSSPSSSDDRDAVAAAGGLPGSDVPFGSSGQRVESGGDELQAGELGGSSVTGAHPAAYVPSDPKRQAQYIAAGQDPVSPLLPDVERTDVLARESQYAPKARGFPKQIERHDSKYGDWMGPAAGGALIGAAGMEAYKHHEQQKEPMQDDPQSGLLPVESGSAGVSSHAPAEHEPAAAAPAPPPTSEHQEETVLPVAGTEYSIEAVQAQGVSSDGPGAVSYGDPIIQQPPPAQQQETFVPISHQREYNGFPVQEGPSPTSMFSSTNSALTDPAGPVKALADDPNFTMPRRPTLESHPSVATISELHVPGEFPPTPALSGTPSL